MPNHTDAFDRVPLNTALWSPSVSGAGSVAIIGGRLVCTADIGGGSSSGAVLAAVNAMNFAQRRRWCIELESADHDDAEIYAQLQKVDDESELKWNLNAGILSATSKNAGVDAVNVTTAYDAALHRWLGFRFDGLNVLWETSRNGIGWSELTRAASAFALTSLALEFGIETETAGAHVAVFRNAGPPPLRMHRRLPHSQRMVG